MNHRRCGNCGAPVVGRLDKKFCDDHCRNDFNNARRAQQEAYIRRIFRILRRNRVLLQAACPGSKSFISKDQMDKSRYDYRYFTYSFITASGKHYYQVFDYAFHPFIRNHTPRMLIVYRPEQYDKPELW